MKKIRIYVLNHLYSIENITDYLDLFLKTAESISDDVGCGLANGMYFWAYHGVDLKLAHKYNHKSFRNIS
ncbi:MAG: hypothetical protein L6U99_01175 [Clostridium sp.]|nr:MAG: hypothetical protein L6U99_01175 [Clostridium sp.]